MNILKIIIALIVFVVGIILTITLVGAIIGIPLIIMAIFLFISGLLSKGLIGKTLKLALRIAFVLLIIFIIFAGITMIFDGGKEFWNDAVVVPVMKPFSEPCGSSDHYYKQECDCDGTMLRKTTIGPTEYYCYGECNNCQCSQLNETTQLYDQVECQ